jgi:RimJ/RimL family protein N-acetyltransferase
VIRTDRLLLRRWSEPDREPFAAMNADPAVMEHMQGVLSRDRSDAFVDRIERHWDEHGWGLWAVEVRGVAPFIGFVGLWPVEVGWRLARAHWGYGFATEAAIEALRFGFIDVGLTEIVSFTVVQNVRSRRVMERIGLVRDPSGDFAHPKVDPVAFPQLVPHVLYRVARADWLNRRVSD